MNWWLRECRPIIAAAIAEGRASGLGGKALKAHVSKAYPFGERAVLPYKIWRREVRRQLAERAAPTDLSRYWIDLFARGKEGEG